MHRVRLRRVAGIICVGIAASSAATAVASGGAGTLDRSFGDHGKVLTRFKHRTGRQSFGHPGVPGAYSVLVDSKNRAVAIGTADEKFALARYKPNGRLDRSFSGNGKVTTQVSVNHREPLSRAYAGAIDSRGRIVVAGSAWGKPSGYWIALARYKPNGQLDRSFGDQGEVRTLIGGRATEAWARAVVIDPKGRIVVAGLGPGDAQAVLRYKPNGKLDPSFGTNGTVTTGDINGAESVAIDSQRRIVTGSYSTLGGRASDFALARYEPDGTLDPSFGDGGKVVTHAGGRDELHSIAVDSQDRIVAAGESRPPGGSLHFAIARYLENGSLDGSFGDGGEVDPDFEGHNLAHDVSIDSRGRIVAAGRAGTLGHRKFALARYLPDGRLDPTFSHDGKAITTFGNGKSVQGANGVAIDSKHRIVAAGFARGRFALARYHGQ
jgi:uncharacterized delta-60 repeat protein